MRKDLDLYIIRAISMRMHRKLLGRATPESVRADIEFSCRILSKL